MDPKFNAEKQRDIAIGVFQDSNNPPQVRARAYIYADAMQSMLSPEVKRPTTIPSLEMFQGEMIAVLLRSFADSTRKEDGSFPLGFNEFFAWSDEVHKEPHEGLIKQATETAIGCLEIIQHEYNGVPIEREVTKEIYRFISLRAFAIVPALITSIADAQSEFVQLISRVHRDAWGEAEFLSPVLQKTFVPIFTIQPNEETEQAPAVVGFLTSCHRRVFFWEPEDQEVERLLSEGAGNSEDMLQNLLVGRLKGTGAFGDMYARAKSQVRLNQNIRVAIEALQRGEYPGLPSVIPELSISMSTEMFASK